MTTKDKQLLDQITQQVAKIRGQQLPLPGMDAEKPGEGEVENKNLKSIPLGVWVDLDRANETGRKK